MTTEPSAPDPAPDKGPWRVTDIGSASWAMRKLAQARATITESAEAALAERRTVTMPVVRWVDEQIVAIEEAHRARTSAARGTAQFMEAALEAWLAGRIAGQLPPPELDANDDPIPPSREAWDKVTKSIQLAYGTVAAKRSPGTWEWDEDEMIAFLAEAAPELLVAKLGPKKAIVARLMEKDGRVFLDGEEVTVEATDEPDADDSEHGGTIGWLRRPARITPPRPEVTYTVTPAEWTPPPAGIVLPDPADAPDMPTTIEETA